MKRHIMIGLPAYTGMVWVPTMMSLFYGLWAIKDIKVELCPVLFNGEIAASRSLIAMVFLASEATDLLFIDWDVSFSAPDLERLLSHEVDFVACDYPRRMEPLMYSTRLMRENGHWRSEIRDDGLMEVEAVPAGLMRLSKNVVQRMVDGYPELQFTDPLNPVDGRGCAMFANLVEDGQRWGEDNSFCRRWRKLDGKIYVDTKIQVGHWGHKQFAGDYRTWLDLALTKQPYEVHVGKPMWSLKPAPN